jgi:diacylglycerol kinase family enzyme
MDYHVIFNARSGTALVQGLSESDLAEGFRAAGLAAKIDSSEDDLEQRIDRALSSNAQIVVCAGGDGTVTAVARRLSGSNKTLALIPLGTANMLARDLKIPLSLTDSISALEGMVATEIDAAEVNGRLFLHKVVVGVVPAIAAAREKVRGRGIAGLVKFARYMVRRLNNARRTAVSISSRDTNDRIERIHAIAVANNAYDQGWGKLFSRTCLTSGSLTLYVLRHLTFIDALRLGIEMIAGRWQEDEAVSIETVRSVTLGAKRKSISAMIDGEVEIFETPLVFRIRPRALRVLVPQMGEGSEEGSRVDADPNRTPLGSALRAS